MSDTSKQVAASDDMLHFNVWRETNIFPRRKLAAFRNEVDALAFAEYRARVEGENETTVETTIRISRPDGTEILHKAYPSARAAIAKAGT